MKPRCHLCHRELKDAESIKRGYGRTCWLKAHGEFAKRRRGSVGRAKIGGGINDGLNQLSIFDVLGGEESGKGSDSL